MTLPETKQPDPSPEEIQRWDSIIDSLRGSCDSLNSVADDGDALLNDLRFCAYLDQHIFTCSVCGWWCDMDEESSDDYDLDEWTCRDCCEDQA